MRAAPGTRAITTIGLVLTAMLGAGGTRAEEASPKDSTATPRSSCPQYENLLRQFLVVTSTPGKPLETRFNYTALRRSPDRNQLFLRVRQELLHVKPSLMNPKERLAWAINAYNFVVVQAVTENLFDSPVTGQKGESKFFYRNRHPSVRTITIDDIGFFEAPLFIIEDRKYSLNAFERHFVFFDYDSTKRQPPPKGFDPRAHFALNCGAKGCPPLRPVCYRADLLDQQLDHATRETLASPVGMRRDEAGKIELTQIFDWYRGDFGGLDSAFDLIKRYAPREYRAQLDPNNAEGWTWLPWDWDLNHSPDE
jgi:Protein of unknown function, DUF547